MSEEKQDTFKISGTEYPVRLPKGRAGRRATNYLMRLMGGGDVTGSDLSAILEDDDLENKYLHVILGVDKELLETEGTTGEILSAMLKVVSNLFEGFEVPEVEAALKNSESTPGEDEPTD